MGGMNNAGIKHGIFTVIPQREWLIKKKKSWGVIGAGYLRAGNSAFWIDVSFGGLFEIMVKDRHRQDIFAREIRRY